MFRELVGEHAGQARLELREILLHGG